MLMYPSKLNLKALKINFYVILNIVNIFNNIAISLTAENSSLYAL